MSVCKCKTRNFKLQTDRHLIKFEGHDKDIPFTRMDGKVLTIVIFFLKLYKDAMKVSSHNSHNQFKNNNNKTLYLFI